MMLPSNLSAPLRGIRLGTITFAIGVLIATPLALLFPTHQTELSATEVWGASEVALLTIVVPAFEKTILYALTRTLRAVGLRRNYLLVASAFTLVHVLGVGVPALGTAPIAYVIVNELSTQTENGGQFTAALVAHITHNSIIAALVSIIS